MYFGGRVQQLLPVKELPPLRVRDLFDPSILPDKDLGLKLLNLANETAASSRGAIVNTFEALEAHELAAVRDELAADHKGIPTFAVGPLHKLASIDGVGAGTTSRTSSLRNQDRSCIEWLDTQEGSGSVLYVSFGSVVRVTEDELAEVAWGLADSGKPFLWVARRGLVLGLGDGEETQTSAPPQGFERAVEGRGKVVEWAPQEEVLAHPAVGGFWTHSGWKELYAGERLRGGADAVEPEHWRPAGDREVRGGCVEDGDPVGRFA